MRHGNNKPAREHDSRGHVSERARSALLLGRLRGLRKVLSSHVLLLFFLIISFALPVYAQTSAKFDTDPNSKGFRIVICDGPEGAGHINPSTGGVDPKSPLKQGYVPCDFNGIMMEIQHLINIMIILGVLGAIVGATYAGALYISGKPGNIDKAHSIFPKIFFGFIIMLSAWFIVYELLGWLTNNQAFRTLLGSHV